MIWATVGAILLAITLLWHDNSDNEEGFLVEKSVSGCIDGFEVFAYVEINVESLADNMGSPGDCYRVAAFNSYGVSEYSNTAQVPKSACKGKSGNC